MHPRLNFKERETLEAYSDYEVTLAKELSTKLEIELIICGKLP